MKKYTVKISAIICAVSLVFMIVALIYTNSNKEAYIPPTFETNVQSGTVIVPEDLNYTPLEVEDNFIVYICTKIIVEENLADIYLTNDADNDVWIKLRVLDEDDQIIAETGIIKQGEYLQTIEFTEQVSNGQSIKLKVMAYEPETYYSEGSFVINNTITE